MLTAEEAEVRNILEAELAGLLTLRGLEAEDVEAVYVLEMEGRAGVSGSGGDFDVREFDVLAWRMKMPVAGRSPNMVGSGYLLGFSAGSWRPCRLRRRRLVQIDVADLEVLDRVVGHSGDDGGQQRGA